MKSFLFTFFLSLLISVNVFAQTEIQTQTLPVEAPKALKFKPNMDITAGYVPNPDVNALKFSYSANNIVLKRGGFYTSFEKGLDSDYFSHLVGITGSIIPQLYLWGGIGLFGNSGLFDGENGLRKEMGVGIIPFKSAVVRLGWSYDVGFTCTVGWQIPFKVK